MLSKLIKALALALALVLSTWGFIEWQGRKARERLESRFAKIANGMSVEDRYPARSENRTVERLLEIGTALGIRIVNDSTEESEKPTAAAVEAWGENSKRIRHHLLEIRRQGSDEEPPESPELTAFLEQERESLEQLRAALLEQEPPVWSMDLSQGFDTAVPNYVGLMQLQRLLLLDAHENLREGDSEIFLESLEASWRFNEAVSQHPFLIAKLVSTAVLNDQIPLLMKMREPSSEWQQRVKRLQPLAGLLQGLRMEAWVVYDSARRDQVHGLSRRALPPIGNSYLRYCFYDYAERMLAFVEGLPQESLVGFDPDQAFEENLASFPFWNVVGKMMTPIFRDVWLKGARAELAVDLVAKVFEIREAMAAGELQSIPARQEAGASDLFWELEAGADSVSIRLDGDLGETPENPLPLSYRLDIPPTSLGRGDRQAVDGGSAG